jgi:hypothetical protein
MATATPDRKVGTPEVGAVIVVVCPACGVQATIVPRFGDVVVIYHLCRPDEHGTRGRHPVRMELLEATAGGQL